MAVELRYPLLTPEGRILLPSGFNTVRRWDGIASAVRDAGVPKPPTGVSLAANGAGTITGVLYAYQRWLDADGQISNLSAISSALSISVSTGSITAATNAAPIVITSAAHGLATNNQVYIAGVIGNYAANGRWVITKVNDDSFSLNNSIGSGTYSTGGTWYQGTAQIDYTSVDVPSDSRVVTRQILRTKHGDPATLYVDVEDTTLVGTSFSSTNDDDDLTGDPIPITNLGGDDLHVHRYGEPPAYKPFMSHNNGRVIGVGDPIYRRGSVVVTNGSATVTGLGTNWNSTFIGRLLYITGSTAYYTITAVASATSMTIDSTYAGTTNQYAQYAIIPDNDRRKVLWSEALLPEAWDDTPLSKQIPEDSESGEITGAFSLNRQVWITAENRVWNFYFQQNPKHDADLGIGPQRGCVNQRCHPIVDGAANMLDRRGIYSFSGSDLNSLSDGIQDIFDGLSDFPYRIDWRWRRYFHAVDDPESGVLRFFVSFGGRYPQHAIAYHYRLKRWWIEQYATGVVSSCLGFLNGKRQVYLGLEGKQIVALGHGHLDGPPVDGGATLRGTVTSAGHTWIADSAATFPASADIVNTPLHIVGGTGKGQWRKIVAVSSTTLKVDMPWTTVPDTTSVYQIGGIRWNWKSGWFRMAEKDGETPRRWEVVFKPTTRASMFDLYRYLDRSATADNEGRTTSQDDNDGIGTTKDAAYNEIDSTKSTGFVMKEMPEMKDTFSDGRRYIQLELVGVTNGERQTVYQTNLFGAQA